MGPYQVDQDMHYESPRREERKKGAESLFEEMTKLTKFYNWQISGQVIVNNAKIAMTDQKREWCKNGSLVTTPDHLGKGLIKRSKGVLPPKQGLKGVDWWDIYQGPEGQVVG